MQRAVMVKSGARVKALRSVTNIFEVDCCGSQTGWNRGALTSSL